MASTPAVRKARKSIGWLFALIVVLVGVIGIGIGQGEATVTPKLALDLQGGTQILLAPKTDKGDSISPEQVEQAVAIIRQRVDAAGVSEAEVTTQGGSNILVAIPGKVDDATMQRIEASARLDFRPVLSIGAGIPIQTTAEGENAAGESGSTDEAADGAADAAATDAGEATADTATADTATGDAAADAAATDDADASGDAASTDAAGTVTTVGGKIPNQDDSYWPETLPKEPGSTEWLTPQILAAFEQFSCADENIADVGESDAKRPLITCDLTKEVKYILGPVEMNGDAISDASAGLVTTQTGGSTGTWAVNLVLNADGTKKFTEISQRLYGATEPLNQFAFVIDGRVLSAPAMQGLITDGRPQITGNFTQEGAEAVADQLKYGALPISFTVQSQEDISATLGTSQLSAGLIAGLIGLVIVVIYSIFQYRGLAVLTVASLAVAALLTYLLLTLLSWRQGYRLSLAGVAGIIVAIGFTADSFIVYFERVRDSLRDGFRLSEAVEQGWKQAIRTILASDGVNFLAAAVLFALAIGNVRGFAFTLGLTTLIDLVVVALFTHPMLTLMAKTRFWGGGHRFSGLNPDKLGAVYRGRAQFRAQAPSSAKQERKQRGGRKEAQRRQTIAERKALAAAESKEG